MRGKVVASVVVVVVVGITPAYAGKRRGGWLTSTLFQDHPRLCGEKLCPFSFARLFLGSPPPMRGKAFP